MKFRNHSKGGNLFSSISHQKNMAKRQVALLKLKNTIDWSLFKSVLEEVTGYNTKNWSKGGNLLFDPLRMFKILILQCFHGLSDEATEFQIGNRLIFMNSLDLEMGDYIPDANTIWGFKELIERDNSNDNDKLFACFRGLLNAQELIAKEGSTQ